MNAFLFSVANALVGAASKPMLAPTDDQWAWLEEIKSAVDLVLYPILALVATAGIIYSIVLGVNLARAESSEKRDEAKKRMINAIIGFVSVIALIFVMKIVVDNMEDLVKWLNHE